MTNSSDTVEATKKFDVLIVGAGLTGLMMAAQLLRHGVCPMIIDLKFGPDKSTLPVFLQARNLEMLCQLGMEEAVIQKSTPYTRMEFDHRGVDLDVGTFPTRDTFFLGTWMLPAWELERLLIDRLTSHACQIHWGARLTSLTERDTGVSAQMLISENGQEAANREENWEADWVLGADGAYSTVRHTLGVAFDGPRFRNHYFEAEMQIRYDRGAARDEFLPGGLPDQAPRILARNNHLLMIFPAAHKNKFYLLGTIPANAPVGEHLIGTFGRLPGGQQLEPVGPIRTGNLQRRTASRFSSRRCFLVGDAARQHLPGTGQEVNAGFQDAWNLGWKLAGVVNGRIDPGILFSYHDERYSSEPGSGRWIESFLRFQQIAPGLFQSGLPLLAGWLNRKPIRLERAFRLLSGLSISHRHSALVAHYSSSERIRAGDRFPWYPLFDERKKSWTDTRQVFSKPGFVLVVLGNAGSHNIHLFGQWIKQKYPQGLGLYYIPYSPRNQVVFDDFGMSPDAVQAVLVRPDTYIAYMTNTLNTFLFDNYFENVIGWKVRKQFD